MILTQAHCLNAIIGMLLMTFSTNRRYVTCIFCDEEFRTSLGIRIATVTAAIIGQQQQQQPSIQSDQPMNSASCSSTTITASAVTGSARSATAAAGVAGLPHSIQTGSGRTDSRPFSTGVGPFSSLPASIASIPGPGTGVSSQMSSSLPDWGTGSSSVDNNDDSVVCHCGQQAIVLTVKKAGPNQGEWSRQLKSHYYYYWL